ncbi:hypothetical protein OK348_01665 [Flavobacterium sp. MXW15]|uniref:Uncharacterized protein n=1 Tax=Xanthomonas chitinilytica TaxID=2989819 RepID=A0ABT3JUG6_9XANT|nr:hypothetical protein [Xanthomonas sp. H13-6]MCW4453513.1 hypothetical protein [Flavobacterium sp. MXW15]MCW4472134.1 hypothetical protein [Xanthomonas sp. H13-6]
MTTTVNDYYQPGWREQRHACPACEWQGSSRDMEMELHDEQSEYHCPECEMPLLIVLHPTLEQLRAAAAAGHPEAQEQLAILASAPRPD